MRTGRTTAAEIREVGAVHEEPSSGRGIARALPGHVRPGARRRRAQESVGTPKVFQRRPGTGSFILNQTVIGF